MPTGRVRALVASLITSASLLACQREAAPDAIETATAALTPVDSIRTSHPRADATLGAAEVADAPSASMPLPTRLSSAAVEAVIPSEIAGTWEVVEILVNRVDGKPRTYRPGDARLVVRSLTIREGRVRFSFGADLDCRQVRWPRRELTWGTLSELAFRPPPKGQRRTTFGDFWLTAKRNQPVTVYPLSTRDSGWSSIAPGNCCSRGPTVSLAPHPARARSSPDAGLVRVRKPRFAHRAIDLPEPRARVLGSQRLPRAG